MENPGGIATGTSDMSPISKQVELLQKVMPNVKKVGIMYTTNERNSEVQVEEQKKRLLRQVSRSLPKVSHQQMMFKIPLKSLMSQTEVFGPIPTDNMIDKINYLARYRIIEKQKFQLSVVQQMLWASFCTTAHRTNNTKHLVNPLNKRNQKIYILRRNP